VGIYFIIGKVGHGTVAARIYIALFVCELFVCGLFPGVSCIHPTVGPNIVYNCYKNRTFKFPMTPAQYGYKRSACLVQQTSAFREVIKVYDY
jgi:hypothetical protein